MRIICIVVYCYCCKSTDEPASRNVKPNMRGIMGLKKSEYESQEEFPAGGNFISFHLIDI